MSQIAELPLVRTEAASIGPHSEGLPQHVSPSRLTDFVQPYVLQCLVEQFFSETHQPVTIVDDKVRDIVRPEGWQPFCKLYRSVAENDRLCRESDRQLMGRSGEGCQEARCHLGLLNYCLPIRFRGDVIAYLVGGQFLNTDDPRENDRHSWRERVLKNSTFPAGGVEELFEKWSAIPRLSSLEIEGFKGRFHRLHQLIEALVKAAGCDGLVQLRPFLEKLAKASELEQVIQHVLKHLPQFVHAHTCSIFLVQWHAQENTSRLVLYDTTYEKLRPRIQTLAYRRGQGLTGWVWKHAKTLLLMDITNPSELALYPDLEWAHISDDSERHREFLGVPIIVRGNVVGVIRTAFSDQPNGFTILDEIAAESAAREIGHSLSEQWNSRSRELLRSVTRLQTKLLHVTSVDRLVEDVLETMEQILSTSRSRRQFYFIRLRTSKSYWEIVASRGNLQPEEDKPSIFSIDEGLAGKAIREGEPVIVMDVNSASRDLDPIPLNKDMTSGAVVPLQFAGECFGALAIDAAKEYSFFVDDPRGSEQGATLAQGSLDEIDMLKLIAEIAASALAGLNSRQSAVQERDKAFQAFAGAADHALRNWLTIFEGNLRTVENPPGFFQSSLRSMRTLLSSFQGFISAANVTPKRTSLKKMLSAAKGANQREGIEWHFPQYELNVYVDEKPTVALITELIANAFVYGAPPVEVRVHLAEPRPDNQAECCCVHVVDHGQGIPAEIRRHIFDFGWSSKPDHGGMGLSSCKYLAERQGGLLDELGTPGSGAHFRLFLPTVPS